ncbi:hypothetical protein L5515_011342 [Caenorhabditis briggsae]|uniref:Uncharacterized protein n=2 Tax=Caenorhabditis briggsae TaxID=6238 RepID=A0AAE9D4D4_CAEBR|nr:hypothetical protein L3Y34_004224 [Caenorhabditis briggsae]UMM28554.1 hypothetical protein L5515_011342 [Caenorhabditis briggsae]
MSAAATNQSNQPNSNISSSDLQMLLPKCLELIGNETKSAELRIAYDAPTNQTTYQYALVWEDPSHGAEEKYRVAVTEANKIMLALKAKKMGKACDFKKGSKETIPQEQKIQVESHYQELPFPPDLRSRSQCEKNEKPNSSSTTSSSDSTSSNGNSTVTESEKSATKTCESSKSYRPKKLESVGCLNDLEKVSVKVIVIDDKNFRGKLRPISSIRSTTSTNLKKVLTDVIHQNFENLSYEQLIRTCGILYAFHDHKRSQKLRRVRPSDVDNLKLHNLPRLKGSVVVILDIVNYIAKGRRVPIQILEEE